MRATFNRWVLPTLGGLPLDRITPAAVPSWHSRISATTGPTATQQAYAVLRAILSTAVADDALSRNPCRLTALDRREVKSGRCWTWNRFNGSPPGCPITSAALSSTQRSDGMLRSPPDWAA
jgi:hypothetical protein